MKAIETVLHLRRSEPARVKSMIPAHVWRLVAPYGLTPQPGEASRSPSEPSDSDTPAGLPAGVS
jgi:coenzyme F420 hydrogenase subunit beta